MTPPARTQQPTTWFGRRWEAMGAFLAGDLWRKELGSLSTLRALGYKGLRVLYLTLRGFHLDRCLLRASALTFMTGLSIVPLLAFVFAVAKGLGAYDVLLNDVIRPLLDQHLGGGVEGAAAIAGGSEVRDALEQVLLLVQNTRVGSLGTFGLAILVYTVVKLLGSIEHTFNEIWGVHKSRSILRRLSNYLSIIVVVPILLTTAAAVTTSLQSQSILDYASRTLGLDLLVTYYARFGPFVAVWIGFTFVYMFMPNTRVRPSSAILGGLIGGALWQLAQVLHLRFQVGVANYNAIYSTFAALPIFMFWLYLSWTTVLLGAEVACAHQGEPAFRQVMRARNQDPAYLEAVAVRAMGRVAVTFLAGKPPLRVSVLAQELGVPERSVDDVLERLRDSGLVSLGEDPEGASPEVLPARDLSHIRLQDILDSLRGGGDMDLPVRASVDREADRWLNAYRTERVGVPSNKSLYQLAQACLETDTDRLAQTEGEGQSALI
jgi:membrane protein